MAAKLMREESMHPAGSSKCVRDREGQDTMPPAASPVSQLLGYKAAWLLGYQAARLSGC